MPISKELNKLIENLSEKLMDRKKHRKVIQSYTYLILAIVSLVMTIINIITSEVRLGFATGVFALFCFINLLLTRGNEKTTTLASILFAPEFLALLTFFTVHGYPGGFSILWIVLVPMVSMLFYGVNIGLAFSGVCFLMLIFFLWVPAGQNLVQGEAIYSTAHISVCENDGEYAKIFRLRFPFLYLAVCCLSIVLEAIKAFAYSKLSKMSQKNQFLADHDVLTGLYNRYGFRDEVQDKILTTTSSSVAVMICDIDSFKLINDTYGHLVGDEILVQFASLLQDHLGKFTCRYGGDEFLAVLHCNEDYEEIIRNFKEIVKNYEFTIEKIKICTTISIGLYIASASELNNFDYCLKCADINLYQAKNGGKNLLSVSHSKLI